MLKRSLLASVLVIYGCAGPTEHEPNSVPIESEPAPAPVEPLTPTDLEQLGRQEKLVQSVLSDTYGPSARLTRSMADLELLQRLVDDKVFQPSQTYQLQSLGVVLGNVLNAETPLKWVIATDEWGRDPALQYPNTTVIVFPVTMISKRIEEGRSVELQELFSTIAAHVEEIAEDPEYKR